MAPIERDALPDLCGQRLAVSDWTVVDQPRIDAFAEISGDRQFIHTDPVRAAETPFGGTIAHGMLSLSILSGLAFASLPPIAGQRDCVNYGFDKLRFVAPVPVGSALRGLFTLRRAEPRGRGDLMLTLDAALEIRGQSRPALITDWLLLYRF